MLSFSVQNKPKSSDRFHGRSANNEVARFTIVFSNVIVAKPLNFSTAPISVQSPKVSPARFDEVFEIRNVYVKRRPKGQIIKYLSDDFAFRHRAFAATYDRAIKPSANIAPWRKPSVRKLLCKVIFHLTNRTLFSLDGATMIPTAGVLSLPE
jgi:hypothetical protein